jgi:hypothetical protein
VLDHAAVVAGTHSPSAAPIYTRRRRCATEALLRAELLPRCVWEPSAGRGSIVNVLRGKVQEAVLVRAISKPDPSAPKPKKPKPANSFDKQEEF